MSYEETWELPPFLVRYVESETSPSAELREQRVLMQCVCRCPSVFPSCKAASLHFFEEIACIIVYYDGGRTGGQGYKRMVITRASSTLTDKLFSHIFSHTLQ